MPVVTQSLTDLGSESETLTASYGGGGAGAGGGREEYLRGVPETGG